MKSAEGDARRATAMHPCCVVVVVFCTYVRASARQYFRGGALSVTNAVRGAFSRVNSIVLRVGARLRRRFPAFPPSRRFGAGGSERKVRW